MMNIPTNKGCLMIEPAAHEGGLSLPIYELMNNNCTESQLYLSLTPLQFDQDQSGGWRVIAELGIKEYVMSGRVITTKILEAIELMKYYVNHYKFAKEDYYLHQLIRFHIAQCYAEINNYDYALLYFNELKLEGYNKMGHEYLEFTIRFLEGNIDECQNIYDSLPKDGSIINTDTIQRMNKYSSQSYLEAYYGMNFEEIKKQV